MPSLSPLELQARGATPFITSPGRVLYTEAPHTPPASILRERARGETIAEAHLTS